MAKYRKKPIVVEAERFYPQSKPWPKGVQHGRPKPWGKLNKYSPGYWIMTKEGWFEVTIGDWIITGIKGEKYPCKPDIFELTYEAIEDAG